MSKLTAIQTMLNKLTQLKSKVALPEGLSIPALTPMRVAVGGSLGGVCVLYLILFIFIGAQGDTTLKAIESKLVVETVSFPHNEAFPAEEEAPIIEAEAAEIIDLQKDALPEAPIAGLTINGRFGPLPVIAPNKLTPFKAYQKPFTRNPVKRPIAIVIRGFGMDAALSEASLNDVPAAFSFLISPYNSDLDAVQKKARMAGHEFWLHIPTETNAFPQDDPGPKALMSLEGLQFNRENLDWALGRVVGYAGVAGYLDESFDGARPMMRGMVQGLIARGLGYFELNPTSDDFARNIALASASPYARNDLSDFYNDKTAREAMKSLKRIARNEGQAIGVLSLSPALLASLPDLIKEAQREGFEFVPLSALSNERL